MTNLQIASTVVELIGKASKQPNELGKFITDFTNATVKWIRPLFLKDDDIEDEDYKSFKDNPSDSDTKDILTAKIKKELNQNSQMKSDLLDLLKKISNDKSEASKIVNNVLGDKNTFFQGGSGNTITITNQ